MARPPTLEEKMDNGADFDEHGRLEIGTMEEILEKHRAWWREHVAVLNALGIPVAPRPGVDDVAGPGDDVEPPEDDDDISDLHDYDRHMLKK